MSQRRLELLGGRGNCASWKKTRCDVIGGDRKSCPWDVGELLGVGSRLATHPGDFCTGAASPAAAEKR